MEWSNTVFIITAGILGIIYFIVHFNWLRGMSISLVIFLSTFIIEYFGSSVQFLFVDYTYTNQFAPVVFGVPIAIGFAWIMVIATGHAILMRLQIQSLFVRALLGGIFALVMDLILDPVAYEVKSYWIWHEPGLYYDIPWTNFFGWFIIAFFFHLALSLVPVKEVNAVWQKRTIALYMLFIVMFTLIALLNQIYLASVIVVLALVVLTMFLRREVAYANS